MTCVVALVLASMATLLRPIHKANEAIYNKRGIIQAVETRLSKPVSEMTDKEVDNVFEDKVNQYVIDAQGNRLSEEEIVDAGYPGGKAENVDMEKEKKKKPENRLLPVFEYNDDGETCYIFSVRGNGLWDAIWGNIALKSDMNTIVGATFDHKSETPGLGAEIKDNPNFREQFQGKEIFSENGEFVSVTVRKGGAKDPDHEVDGISGATITADGVTDMLENGLGNYMAYIEKNRSEKTIN
jgi:Na+-transporting NADH:ubiquinone oxidoreductase subunit C